MARLDKFIQAMRDHGAEALTLASGKPVALVMQGAAKQITKDALGSSQILGLLREIAPPASAGASPGTPQSFSYDTDGGTIEVEV
ncbi:MAG: hypothetical protein ABI836_13770, partial [Gemmatimonadota bacterium]